MLAIGIGVVVLLLVSVASSLINDDKKPQPRQTPARENDNPPDAPGRAGSAPLGNAMPNKVYPNGGGQGKR